MSFASTNQDEPGVVVCDTRDVATSFVCGPSGPPAAVTNGAAHSSQLKGSWVDLSARAGFRTPENASPTGTLPLARRSGFAIDI